MKKEIYNIVFLILVVALVAWLYWPRNDTPLRMASKGQTDFILAVSWQAAFCEKRPNKPECRSQHSRRYDATNFSLHGLWLKQRGQHYCGLPSEIVQLDKKGRWRDLPKLDLSQDLRAQLSTIMPGYRSYLHRHEWYKHGTCMGISPQTYFEISVQLIQDLNNTALQNLFADNIGNTISQRAVNKAANQAYGSDAANKITLSCTRDGNRTLIDELKISYRFDPKTFDKSAIQTALNNGVTNQTGCKGGAVDAVGLQ